ncbi:hypothetical protein V5O48_006038 [Marasmius crinis-equi]|uniref:ABM domain-containing protein n=1 Tax=Marasmius crinis-equi TaxID=585013 RepID=A0ABR3FKT2_9AGAR
MVPILPFLIALTLRTYAVFAEQAQSITIQSFPVKPDNAAQKLADAMSAFKASNSDKIESAFLGMISSDAGSVAEQIFLWNDLGYLDVTQPFLQFSSSPSKVNVSTATVNNKTSLYDALHAPLTETIIHEIAPEVDVDDFARTLNDISENIRSSPPNGYGSTSGFYEKEGKRYLVVVNGWGSPEAAENWLANLDEATAAAFQKLLASLAGPPQPTFKHVVEIV